MNKDNTTEYDPSWLLDAAIKCMPKLEEIWGKDVKEWLLDSLNNCRQTIKKTPYYHKFPIPEDYTFLVMMNFYHEKKGSLNLDIFAPKRPYEVKTFCKDIIIGGVELLDELLLSESSNS